MSTNACVPVVEREVMLPDSPEPTVRRKLRAQLLTERERAFDPRESSWEQIVADHRGFVLRRALWLTRNPADAEDLTHDVFLRVFGALDSYVPGGNFHGWLYRITTNLYLDQVRRRNRIRFDALSEAHERRLVSSEPDPADAVQEALLEPHLQQALDALPPMFREVVVLRDVQGLSYDQVARTLGVKQATVRTRIHRGRARLRAALTSAPHDSLRVGAGQVSTGMRRRRTRRSHRQAPLAEAAAAPDVAAVVVGVARDDRSDPALEWAAAEAAARAVPLRIVHAFWVPLLADPWGALSAAPQSHSAARAARQVLDNATVHALSVAPGVEVSTLAYRGSVPDAMAAGRRRRRGRGPGFGCRGTYRVAPEADDRREGCRPCAGSAGGGVVGWAPVGRSVARTRRRGCRRRRRSRRPGQRAGVRVRRGASAAHRGQCRPRVDTGRH